jgi:hypothetical protein
MSDERHGMSARGGCVEVHLYVPGVIVLVLRFPSLLFYAVSQSVI